MFKKIALLAAFAASLSCAANFGLRGALNISDWASSEGAVAGGSAVGFNAGLAMKAPLSSIFQIVPEVTIDMRSVGDDVLSFDSWVLDIPVMFRLCPATSLYLEVGPQIGIVLSDEWTSDGETIDSFFGNTNTIELALDFGIGYTVMERLDLNFRYIYGMTNVFEDIDTGFGSVEIDIQNLQMQFAVTYWF